MFRTLINSVASGWQMAKNAVQFVGNKFLQALHFITGIPARISATYAPQAIMSTRFKHKHSLSLTLSYFLFLTLLPLQFKYWLVISAQLNALLEIYFNHPNMSHFAAFSTSYVLSEIALETEYRISTFGWIYTLYVHLSPFITRILDTKLSNLENEIDGTRLEHYIKAIKNDDYLFLRYRLGQHINLSGGMLENRNIASLTEALAKHVAKFNDIRLIDFSNNKLSVLPHLPLKRNLRINMNGNPLTEVSKYLFARINTAGRTTINFAGNPPAELNAHNLQEHFTAIAKAFKPTSLSIAFPKADFERFIALSGLWKNNGHLPGNLIAKIMTYLLPIPKKVQAAITESHKAAKQLIQYAQPDTDTQTLINQQARSALQLCFLRDLHTKQAAITNEIYDKCHTARLTNAPS